MKHTQEPWAVVGNNMIVGIRQLGYNRDKPEKAIICEPSEVPGSWRDEDDANAARIVACVNACRGIPTESLTDVVVLRLVEALDEIAAHDPETCNGITPRDCVESMREIAAAALVKFGKGDTNQ